MKVASYNARGLNDPTRLAIFHKWVMQQNLDIVLVQEYKMHKRASQTFHFKGFSCFYGGKQGSYSGVLTLVKNTLMAA